MSMDFFTVMTGVVGFIYGFLTGRQAGVSQLLNALSVFEDIVEAASACFSFGFTLINGFSQEASAFFILGSNGLLFIAAEVINFMISDIGGDFNWADDSGDLIMDLVVALIIIPLCTVINASYGVFICVDSVHSALEKGKKGPKSKTVGKKSKPEGRMKDVEDKVKGNLENVAEATGIVPDGESD